VDQCIGTARIRQHRGKVKKERKKKGRYTRIKLRFVSRPKGKREGEKKKGGERRAEKSFQARIDLDLLISFTGKEMEEKKRGG